MAAVLRRLLVPALVLASLVTPTVALADYQELLKDACRDERVNGTYSQKDYRDALANIPADADQYTNCRDVLRAAQLASARTQAAGRSGAAWAVRGCARAHAVGVRACAVCPLRPVLTCP